MEAVFHRLWNVELYGFLLLTTFDVLNTQDGTGHVSSLHSSQTLKFDESRVLFSDDTVPHSRANVSPRFSCSFSGSCISVWVVEPKCWNGFLDAARNGYVKISLNVSHCQNHDLKMSAFAVYWLWGSEHGSIQEINRCRHLTVCWIPVLAVKSSSTKKQWLDILVGLNGGSFTGSISVIADYRLLKDLSLKTAVSKQLTKQDVGIIDKNRRRATLQIRNKESKQEQKVQNAISRKKRAVNEAQDLAVLMQGETSEAKQKISKMIETDFASGSFNDPVVVPENHAWATRQGANLANMVMSLQLETDEASGVQIIPTLEQLRQQVKNTEQELAETELELKVATAKHARNTDPGQDSGAFLLKRKNALEKIKDLKNKLKDQKTKYEKAYRGSLTGTERKIHGLIAMSPMWSEWSSWSKCSVDCGEGGFSVRRRECETLPDVTCSGISFDMRSCVTGIRCEAQFHDWGGWGPCSVTCGKGVRARSRVCVSGDKDMTCRGPSTMVERCVNTKCRPNAAGLPPYIPEASPAVGAPQVAYILSPGIAAGANAYPVPPQNYYVPPDYGAAGRYSPLGHYVVAGGGAAAVAGGAAAASAANSELARSGGAAAASAANSELARSVAQDMLKKAAVVETGKGPFVITDHDHTVYHAPISEADTEQKVTPETIVFIALFLLCILLLLIAFCIYCVQRLKENNAQKALKDARPFYKQDDGNDDDDLDKKPLNGMIKPVSRESLFESNQTKGSDQMRGFSPDKSKKDKAGRTHEVKKKTMPEETSDRTSKRAKVIDPKETAKAEKKAKSDKKKGKKEGKMENNPWSEKLEKVKADQVMREMMEEEEEKVNREKEKRETDEKVKIEKTEKSEKEEMMTDEKMEKKDIQKKTNEKEEETDVKMDKKEIEKKEITDEKMDMKGMEKRNLIVDGKMDKKEVKEKKQSIVDGKMDKKEVKEKKQSIVDGKMDKKEVKEKKQSIVDGKVDKKEKKEKEKQHSIVDEKVDKKERKEMTDEKERRESKVKKKADDEKDKKEKKKMTDEEKRERRESKEKRHKKDKTEMTDEEKRERKESKEKRRKKDKTEMTDEEKRERRESKVKKKADEEKKARKEKKEMTDEEKRKRKESKEKRHKKDKAEMTDEEKKERKEKKEKKRRESSGGSRLESITAEETLTLRKVKKTNRNNAADIYLDENVTASHINDNSTDREVTVKWFMLQKDTQSIDTGAQRYEDNLLDLSKLKGNLKTDGQIHHTVNSMSLLQCPTFEVNLIHSPAYGHQKLGNDNVERKSLSKHLSASQTDYYACKYYSPESGVANDCKSSMHADRHTEHSRRMGKTNDKLKNHSKEDEHTESLKEKWRNT